MPQVSVVEQVRQLVRETLSSLKLSTAEGLEETILIRNGFYCGRRFAADRGHAIWFCEENQLKFYGASGAVVHVIPQLDRRLAADASPLADVA
jgi:hypothetical protein